MSSGNLLRQYQWLITLALPVLASAVQVTATVDANRLAPNETFTLRIEARDAQDYPDPDISVLENTFKVISGPAQQSSYQWINGKQTSSKSVTWTLLPLKSGNLTIPAIPVKIDRKSFSTEPINLVVGGDDGNTVAPDRSGDIFLVAEIDKNEAYLGQQVSISYKLYTRVNLRGLEYIEQPKFVGFWVEDLFAPSQPQFRNATIKGVNYQVATLYKAALFPTRLGEISIPPMIIRAQIEVKRSQRGRRSYFDDFFSDPFSVQTVQQVIATDSTSLRIRPFPQGRPTNFTGAVGNFTLSSDVDLSQVKANEAVTFTIKVTGTGNINLFELPEMDFPDELEVFPPTTEFEKQPFRDDISGTRTRKYILIPRQAGKYVLPPVNLAFFDPRARQWQQAKTQPIEIIVNQAEITLASNGNLTKEEVALIGKDIRYIKTTAPRWYNIDEKGGNWLLLLAYLLAAVGFAGPTIITEIKSNRSSNLPQRRTRKALRQALNDLDKKEEDQAAQAVRIIYGYLRDKLNLPNANLDPVSAGQLLTGKIEADTVTGLMNLLHRCDADRYAPGAIKAVDDIRSDVCSILEKLEQELP